MRWLLILLLVLLSLFRFIGIIAFELPVYLDCKPNVNHCELDTKTDICQSFCKFRVNNQIDIDEYLRNDLVTAKLSTTETFPVLMLILIIYSIFIWFGTFLYVLGSKISYYFFSISCFVSCLLFAPFVYLIFRDLPPDNLKYTLAMNIIDISGPFVLYWATVQSKHVSNVEKPKVH